MVASQVVRSGSEISVADYLVARVARDGIDTVFGLTGGGIMYLIDALARSGEVSFQAVHHEEFAGVAADGYARAGKSYGVAFATTGPGAAHLFAAVAAAWQDSSPVVFVVGQVKTADSSFIQGLEMRQNGTFEFDTTRTFSPICKSVEVVDSPGRAVDVIERAIALCRSGRPGPVLIEFPLDVQGVAIPLSLGEQAVDNAAPTSGESEEVHEGLRELLVDALTASSRPLVLIGAGVIRAGKQDQLADLLNDAGVPYVVTQLARGGGRSEHPLYLGSPGIKANRSANLAVSECDLLIAIGTSLHQQVTGWDAGAFRSLPSRKIWCELDATTVSARRDMVDDAFNISVEVAAATLTAAMEGVNLNDCAGSWDEWGQHCVSLRDNFMLHYPSHAEVEGRMCLYRAVSRLADFSSDFTAVVTDAGIPWYALAQHYFPSRGSHYISSGSFGAMGMALPMAIGAAAATQGRVLALTGDGSLMTCLSELATLRQSELPIVLVINSNEGYLSIKTTHDRYFGGRRLGTDETTGVFIPKLSSLAATFGLPYRLVRSDIELAAVMAEVTSSTWSGPVMIELVTYVDQKVEPIVESRRNPDGSFSSATLADMSPFLDYSDVV